MFNKDPWPLRSADYFKADIIFFFLWWLPTYSCSSFPTFLPFIGYKMCDIGLERVKTIKFLLHTKVIINLQWVWLRSSSTTKLVWDLEWCLNRLWMKFSNYNPFVLFITLIYYSSQPGIDRNTRGLFNYLGLHLHLGYLAGAFVQSDLQ